MDANAFSLYCALERATTEVNGSFDHRGAVMQEARFVIDEVATSRSDFQHRLQGYNNDSSTTFADIQKVLANLEERIRTQLATAPFKRPDLSEPARFQPQGRPDQE